MIPTAKKYGQFKLDMSHLIWKQSYSFINVSIHQQKKSSGVSLVFHCQYCLSHRSFCRNPDMTSRISKKHSSILQPKSCSRKEFWDLNELSWLFPSTSSLKTYYPRGYHVPDSQGFIFSSISSIHWSVPSLALTKFTLQNAHWWLRQWRALLTCELWPLVFGTMEALSTTGEETQHLMCWRFSLS